MIGDNPVVVVVVVAAIVAYLYMRLFRRRDPRLCPQCGRLVLDTRATGPEITCPHCGTELRREANGTLHRRTSPR